VHRGTLRGKRLVTWQARVGEVVRFLAKRSALRLQTHAFGADPFAPTRRLICAQCNVKISFAEGKFCRNNEKRFGGCSSAGSIRLDAERTERNVI
jgi:hypothetical protein